MAGYRDVSAGAELTDKERQIVSAYDAGATDAQLAERFGFASANGAGNARRRALTKLGRGSEVGGSANTGTATKTRPAKVAGVVVPDIVQTLKDSREQLLHTVDEATSRLESLRTDAARSDEEIIESERSVLVDALTRATEALADFDNMGEESSAAMIENHRKVAMARVYAEPPTEANPEGTPSTEVVELTGAIEKASANLEMAENMLTGMGIDITTLPSIDGASEDEDADEDEENEPEASNEDEDAEPEPEPAPPARKPRNRR